MEPSDAQPSRKGISWITVLKNLLFYGAVPFFVLRFLASPITEAALRSEREVWLTLLFSLGAVTLNWLIYRLLRGRRPSLLVLAHGLSCLLAVLILQYLALPGHYPVVAALTTVGVTLLQGILILLSFWFVSLKTKPAYAAAVTIRVIVGIFLAVMAGQIARDFETGLANGSTWLTIGILVALVLGLFASRIRSAFRRSFSRRRKTGLVSGRICKIVGTTHLDLDDDLVTLFHAHIQYTVNGVSYETRGDITRFTLRRYGKEAFIGSEVPVHYDPENPADTFVEQIQKPAPKDDPAEKETADD